MYVKETLCMEVRAIDTLQTHTRAHMATLLKCLLHHRRVMINLYVRRRLRWRREDGRKKASSKDIPIFAFIPEAPETLADGKQIPPSARNDIRQQI